MEPPLHTENPTLPPVVIDEFNKIAVYKINIQKSVNSTH